MAKREKYHPDYMKIYSEEILTPEVINVLKKSDRKMEYMEVDIKQGQFIQETAEFISAREDSLDRLIDEEKKEFASEGPTPEEIAVHNDETERLCQALEKLKPEEYAIVHALFFEEKTEEMIAKKAGLTQQSISWRLMKIFAKIKIFMNN